MKGKARFQIQFFDIGRNKIAKARKVMRNALAKDESFRQGYIDNIAGLLYDWGITDYDRRNKAAEDILRLIFD